MNDRQKPGRNSCQATDIFFDRRLTYLLDFLLPITHQHDRWIGGFHHIGPKRGIRNHNGRQITVLAMAITFRNLATPPQSQSLSTKYLCFRIEPVKIAMTSFPPLKWQFSSTEGLTGMNLLLASVVPDDLANHLISSGQSKLFCPSIVRRTRSRMSS